MVHKLVLITLFNFIIFLIPLSAETVKTKYGKISGKITYNFNKKIESIELDKPQIITIKSTNTDYCTIPTKLKVKDIIVFHDNGNISKTNLVAGQKIKVPWGEWEISEIAFFESGEIAAGYLTGDCIISIMGDTKHSSENGFSSENEYLAERVVFFYKNGVMKTIQIKQLSSSLNDKYNNIYKDRSRGTFKIRAFGFFEKMGTGFMPEFIALADKDGSYVRTPTREKIKVKESIFWHVIQSRLHVVTLAENYLLFKADDTIGWDVNGEFLGKVKYTGEKNKYIKDYDLAIADLNKTIELDPKNAKGYVSRGCCYADIKKYDLAISDFNKAIELDPKDDFAYIRRGYCYADIKKYDLAISDFNKAIELDSKNAQGYVGRGWCFAGLKKYDLAILDFNKVIDLDPKDAITYGSRGWCYFQLKKYDLAIEDFNIAIMFGAGKAETYVNRSWCYAGLKKYDLAIEDLNKAIELDPKDVRANNLRGWYFFILGYADKAFNDFQSAINKDDKNFIPYFNLGLYYLYYKKDKSKALEYFEKSFILGYDPYSKEIYMSEKNKDGYYLKEIINDEKFKALQKKYKKK